MTNKTPRTPDITQTCSLQVYDTQILAPLETKGNENSNSQEEKF